MEDKEQKIKISFETNAEKTAENVRKLESATIKVEEAEIKLKKANEALAASSGKSVDEIRLLEIAQKKAAIATDTAKASVSKLSTTQEKAGETTKTLGQNIAGLNNPISGAIQGFKALLLQMWAIVTNPVGAILAVIVGAVALLGKAFLSTEEGGNKLSKALSVVSGVFSGLIKVLQPVAAFLIDGIVKGFETAANAITQTSVLIQKGLKAIGLDSAANGLKGVTDAVSNNVKASGKLADAEAKLNESRRESTKLQLDFQKKAEILRQQRDDESNSIEKRFKLNKELAGTLKQQALEELRIANLAKTVSDIRIKQEGKSSANLDERAAALLQISDIQERISGQESEQLANENSLRNEQISLNKEAQTKKDAADKLAEDKRLALIKEGSDAETAIRKTNEDLQDKTDEQKLARQKERALQEIEVLKKKGIDTAELTKLTTAKFTTLETELKVKTEEDERKRKADSLFKDLELIISNKDAENQVRVDAINQEQALLQSLFDSKNLSGEEFNTRQAVLSAARTEIAQKEADAAKALLEQEKAIKEAKIALISGGINAVANLFSKNKKVQKAALVANNAAALAENTINTVTAVGKATKASPLTFGMPWSGIHIAQGAIGAANIIASTTRGLKELGGGNAGSSNTTSMSAPSAAGASGATSSTPQVSFQASSENQISSNIARNAKDQPPIKAFVVSKDITTQQSLDNNRIKSNSI